MSTSDEHSAKQRMEAQENYERIMKKIEPFIPRPTKLKPRPREVWRRGEDLPEEFEERFMIEHHLTTRSSRDDTSESASR